MRAASHSRSSSERSAKTGTDLSRCASPIVPGEASISNPRQVRMHELDRDRPLADPGGDALDGTVTDVAHREYAGNAGFEQVGIPRQAPALGALSLSQQVGPRQDESAIVALHETIEPVGPRRGADEHV